jgi:serine/threonine protein kinase
MESKVIQEGSYGCVVSPPLKCKKSKSRPQRTVGKIIRTKNSKVELSIATLVKAIPGWSRYYVLQDDDDCDSKNFDAHRAVYARLCKVYGSSEDSQLSQLISPYAGSTVRSMTLTPRFNFVASLRHVLEGVSELNEQGICHYDLHDGNVLVDFRGTFRIIDFGAAFLGDSTDETVVKKHTYVFSPEFQPEAPELSIQHGLSGGLQLTDALEQTMNRKKEFALAHRLIGLSAVAQRRELIEFWLHEDTWKGESWVEFYRKYWRKWDSWAVGVLFLHILSKCFLMPGFFDVWPTESERIKITLKGLLRSNPNDRMTASEALKVLE